MSFERKLVLLGALYLAQGMPYGFFTQALPVLLREQGLSLPLIGLANLLMLPWALKFAWAPLVDAVHAPVFGRRRAAIIPLQVGSCAILAGLAFAASPDAVWILCIGVLLVNLLSATQDIATDGLAVEVLAPGERGLGNGLQVGGYRTGMIIGGGAMLIVFQQAGWTAAFLGMAAVLALATLPIVLHREAAAPRAPRSRAALAVLAESLRRPGMRRWALVLVTYKHGEWFATGMLRPFLKDAGQSLGEIGTMLGIVGFSSALAGAIAGGALTTRLGRRTALVAFGALQTLAIASFAIAVAVPTVPVFYAVTIVEHVTSAMATAALFTAMMDFSRPEHAGTDYTVQACVVVATTGGAAMVSGASAHVLGYGGHFTAAALISAIGVIVAARYRPSDPSFALDSQASR